jgi:plasmid stabilization system protein ParE
VIPVVLHRAARLELDEAALWYEERRVDLGIEFIAEIDRCLEVIAEYPELAAVVDEDIRRIPVKRFPYSIYYRLEAERIVVLAIFQGKRDPAIWRRRV